MNSFDRRKFIKSVIYGVGITAIGNIPNHLLASTVEKPSKGIRKKEPTELFAKARELFFKKEYEKAEDMYNKILSNTPADISIYDNYKKLLNVQHRTEEIIPYFRKAINKYPNRVDFYDRIAKTFREIATGNQKMEEKVAQAENADLLQASIDCYKEAIQRDTSKKFLYFGLLDTLNAIEQKRKKSGIAVMSLNNSIVPTMSEEEQTLTQPYLQEWVLRKKPDLVNYYRRRPNISTIDVETRLQNIKGKKRRQLYFAAEQESRNRELVKITKRLKSETYRQHYEQENFSKLVALTEEILQEDINETNLLGSTRKCLKKNESWELMEQLYQKRSNKHKDFWTQCGLGNAYTHTNKAPKGKPIFTQLSQNIKYPNGKKINVVYRGLCDCSLAENDIATAKEQLLKGIEQLGGIGGSSLSLLFKYAECLTKEQNYETAKELLRKKLDTSHQTSTDDPMLKYIAPNLETAPELYYLHRLQNKTKSMSKDDQISILCAIAKVQKSEQDAIGLLETCREIEALQPNHPFVRNIQA